MLLPVTEAKQQDSGASIDLCVVHEDSLGCPHEDQEDANCKSVLINPLSTFLQARCQGPESSRSITMVECPGGCKEFTKSLV